MKPQNFALDREQHEHASSANLRQLEAQAARQRSAERALHTITRQLGITLEPDDKGHYDAATLQAQVVDVLERRQVDPVLDATPRPSILIEAGLPFPLNELAQLEDVLAERRAQYHQLERECQALLARKQQLVLSLQGQLDLFRDQVHRGEQLLKEVRHG
ncbi:hypothetical protein [Billgrantia ethanolica]|uniref:Uncharacterized protein n=1 Tax=Billgrantia ethanolica TaxID=2733486 RepID=A0ABS9A925_9GAMM|nr:hypothetical protein [Halomonas ethanolica]MCE8005324.1 hypothetical protein [Halomonas ethanolica]